AERACLEIEGIARIELERFGEVSDGTIMVALRLVAAAAAEIVEGALRRRANDVGEILDGSVLVAEPLIGHRAAEAGGAVVGIEPDRLRKIVPGVREFTLLQIANAAHAMRGRELERTGAREPAEQAAELFCRDHA